MRAGGRAGAGRRAVLMHRRAGGFFRAHASTAEGGQHHECSCLALHTLPLESKTPVIGVQNGERTEFRLADCVATASSQFWNKAFRCLPFARSVPVTR